MVLTPIMGSQLCARGLQMCSAKHRVSAVSCRLCNTGTCCSPGLDVQVLSLAAAADLLLPYVKPLCELRLQGQVALAGFWRGLGLDSGGGHQ